MNIPKNFVAQPYDYHEVIELRIDSLTNLGQGLGRVDGWVILVSHTIPGDYIKARIFRNKNNYSEADLIEILASGADRVVPKCTLYGNCGGCQYQHMAYGAQLAWKQKQVGELLEHMAGLHHPVAPIIPSPKEYAYRSKITPHFQKPRDGKIKDIGFLANGSRNRILDVPQCAIAMDEINEKLTDVRKDVRLRASQFRKGVTLLLRASADGQVHTDAKEMANEKVGDLKFRFQAGEFFQNNPSILEPFTEHVRSEASGSGARFLIDAYCGSGLFALTSACAFEKVAGIEVSENSVMHARGNAEINQIENVRFIEGSSEAIFEDVEFPGAETAVIIDPPRKGCSEEFLHQLFAFGPRRVVYVSCNPATQMRDLKLFHEAQFQIAKIQPFDLFPQTRHFECVMTLEKPQDA